MDIIRSFGWWHVVHLDIQPILHTQKTLKTSHGFMVFWRCCLIQLLRFICQKSIGLWLMWEQEYFYWQPVAKSNINSRELISLMTNQENVLSSASGVINHINES